MCFMDLQAAQQQQPCLGDKEVVLRFNPHLVPYLEVPLGKAQNPKLLQQRGLLSVGEEEVSVKCFR